MYIFHAFSHQVSFKKFDRFLYGTSSVLLASKLDECKFILINDFFFKKIRFLDLIVSKILFTIYFLLNKKKLFILYENYLIFSNIFLIRN